MRSGRGSQGWWSRDPGISLGNLYLSVSGSLFSWPVGRNPPVSSPEGTFCLPAFWEQSRGCKLPPKSLFLPPPSTMSGSLVQNLFFLSQESIACLRLELGRGRPLTKWTGAGDLRRELLPPTCNHSSYFQSIFLLSRGPSVVCLTLYQQLGFSFLCFAVSDLSFCDSSLPKCSHVWDLLFLHVFECKHKKFLFQKKNRDSYVFHLLHISGSQLQVHHALKNIRKKPVHKFHRFFHGALSSCLKSESLFSVPQTPASIPGYNLFAKFWITL